MIPLSLVIVSVLFAALMVVYENISQMFSEDAPEGKFQIALVGETGDSYLNMGIQALHTFDSSRFAVDVLQLTEAQAQKALMKGEIGAYVVIPDGFVEQAMHGRVITLKYVSTVGATGLVSLFKDEITMVISDIVIACQRGMYGIENALSAVGHTGDINRFMNEVSISYVKYVLVRSQMYEVDSLNMTDGLGMDGTLFCGIFVLFISLCILPFGSLYFREDYSFDKILMARGYGVTGFVLGEFASLFSGCILLFITAMLIFGAGVKFLSVPPQWVSFDLNVENIFSMAIVILMISAFTYMLFQCSGNLISGTLLCFFAVLVLCFAGGCIYPLYFFPISVQKVLAFLPHSLAREQIGFVFTGESTQGDRLLLIGFSAIFLLIAIFIRKCRLRNGER